MQCIHLTQAHLSDISRILQGREQDVVDVDRQNLQKPLVPSCLHSVSRVIDIGPSICPIRETAISKMVDYTLVWILLRPHEHETGKWAVRDDRVRCKEALTVLAYEDSHCH